MFQIRVIKFVEENGNPAVEVNSEYVKGVPVISGKNKGILYLATLVIRELYGVSKIEISQNRKANYVQEK